MRQGKKYQSDPVAVVGGKRADGNNGWACLKFSMADSQYYMYQYTSSGTNGATGDLFSVHCTRRPERRREALDLHDEG